MRLFRTDPIPVLAIIAGGAIGVLTSSLAFLARSDHLPPDPLVARASVTDSRVKFIVQRLSRPGRSSASKGKAVPDGMG